VVGLFSLARYGISAGLAWGVTFGLFFMMQYLVAMGQAEVKEEKEGRVIDFVRVKHESVAKEKERALPTRPKAMDQPNAPDLNLTPKSSGAGLDGMAIGIKAPAPDVPLRMRAGPDLGKMAVRDSKKVPLMRIEPNYPMRARQDGVEGHVVVRFDIDPRGNVQNPTVLSAKPRGVFEREALRAIRRWRYKPTIEGGKPTWDRGQKVRIPFRLND